MNSRNVRLSIKKKEGEYIVRWIENGKFNPEKSYYTDDLEDAQLTMQDMERRLNQ
jgi:hypothetical protein